MKTDGSNVKAGRLRWYLTVGLGLLLTFCAQPGFALTDYMFFSVNGDTTGTSMVQGDSVAWGANCDLGGSLRWDIWYDVDQDGVIDVPDDIHVISYIATDGVTIGGDGPPDNSSTPDGWYVMPPMILGVAAGHYLFKAVNLTDSTFVERTLTCAEMPSPPNTLSGHLVILGHPEPISDLLKNHWIQAISGEAENQVWSAITDDSGHFQINIGSVGTGLTFQISPPAIPGFTAPAEQSLLADGHTEGVDFVYVGPPFGKTDHMFYSVNGDTTATSMIQGDTVAWGANCAGGGSLRWEIWYDLDENEVIDIPGDIQLVSFIATDGDTSGEYGPPDINPVPDGWYITPPMALGVAAGHYIFKAVNLDDPSEVQKPLVCTEMVSPPNTFSGWLIVPGHPAPDSALLKNRWVQAEGGNAKDQIWTALTNDSGRFQINISSAGTGLTFRVSSPEIPGFVSPDEQMLLALGHIQNVNFEYAVPADSVWGYVLDEHSALIMEPVGLWCGPQVGSGGRDARSQNGRYVFFFGESELGSWTIGSSGEGLIPAYMQPPQFYFDNSFSHGIRHDLVCLTADTVMYAKITEGFQPPEHQYKVNVRQESSGAESWAISGTGSNNVVTLHISKMYANGYGAGFDQWNDDYPIPAGYTPDYNPGCIYHPGDTVGLNLTKDILVSDTIKYDPADPPVDWDSVRVYLSGNWHYYEVIPDANGVFTFYALPDTYWLYVSAQGYFADTWGYQLSSITHDTVGGMGFEINRAHCRIHGAITDVPLPFPDYVAIYAHSDSIHHAYSYFAPVDLATGAYEIMLCDGEWTIEAPDFFPRFTPPAPVNLVIGNAPDTARTVDLPYTNTTDVAEADGSSLPTTFALNQNYPNPFNPVTVIEYSVPSRAQVTIEIFNVLGQKIRTLVHEEKSPGYYRIDWDGTDQSGGLISTGVYLYRFKAGDFAQTKKMLLLK